MSFGVNKISSFYYNFIIRSFHAALQVLVFIATSKLLPDNEIGIYSIYVSLLAIAILIMNANFHVGFTTKINNGSQSLDDTISEIYSFILLYWPLATVLCVGTFIFYESVGTYWQLFLINLLAMSFNNLAENYLIAIGKGLFSSMLTALRSSWVLVWLAYLYNTSEIGILSVLQIMCVIELMVAIGVLLFSHKYLNFNLRILPARVIKQSIYKGFLYSVMAIALVVSIIGPKFYLDYFHGLEVVGQFQILYALFIFFPNMLESTVIGVLLPNLVRLSHDNRSLVIKYIPYIAILLISLNLIVLVILFLISDQIFNFFDKNHLSFSLDFFIIISLFVVSFFTLRIFHHVLYSFNLNLELLKGYVIGFVVSIASGYFLIDEFAIVGAAASLLLFSLPALIYFLFQYLLAVSNCKCSNAK